MLTLVVMAGVLAVLVAGFIAFYLHSRTPEWGESEVRKSVLRMLVVIGPLWGMRYQEPRPALPAVTTPGVDREPLPQREPDQPDGSH